VRGRDSEAIEFCDLVVNQRDEWRDDDRDGAFANNRGQLVAQTLATACWSNERKSTEVAAKVY